MMLADTTQLIGVLLILAAAVGYLSIYFGRTIKGGGNCCSDGSCGLPLFKRRQRRPSDVDPRSAESRGAESPANRATPSQFLPAENLADLARRRRREIEAKKQADPPS